MDAPLLRLAIVLTSIFVSTGAKVRTPNFVVTAPTEDIAQQVGQAAESYRRDLAIFWLGRSLPKWSRPCELRVRPGALAAAGETKFQFIRGEVLNWNMFVQGTLERILDSVLPHEINHTIFACHFRRPLPRWADEGAATLFEHRSEQKKQLRLLASVVNHQTEFIPLARLLTMKQYPRDYRAMLIMYAEGFALADFLVQQGGEKKYLEFLADGERVGWPEAIQKNYDHGGITALEKNWQGWIKAGMPRLIAPDKDLIVAREEVSENIASVLGRPSRRKPSRLKETLRLQSPTPTKQPNARQAENKSHSIKTARRLDDAFLKSSPVRPVDKRSQPTTIAPTEFKQKPQNHSWQFGKTTLEAPAPRPKRTHQPVLSRPQAAANDLTQPARLLPSRQNSNTQDPFNQNQFNHNGSQVFQNTSVQRKHLPQERTAVTGSIPQWAGFPGQKELF